MKKILFSVFAMAAMLFATSCSQEEDFAIVADGTEVEVSFTAQLPQEIATRAYSDGKTATELSYAFYDVDADELKPLLEGSAKFSGLKATVTETLATGKTYSIIFWAESEGENVYTVNFDNQTLTVDYTKMKANDENNDAFYAFVPKLKVNGALTQNVELHRPLAQINLGTNDFDAAEDAGLLVSKSRMVAAKLPSVMNLATGETSVPVTVEVAANAIPQDETFPVKDYEYLEMNYVLVGAEKELINCEFFITEKNASELKPTIVVSNVPVQRNYRTNIYGALLTDPATFNVTIEPAYKDPAYTIDPEGTEFTEEELAKDVLVLNNSADLLGFAKLVNKEGKTFEGKTVQLGADIDMAGIQWIPVGTNADDAKKFKGTFDGKDFTISNLTVEQGAAYHAAGFFGALNGTAKNFTIDGANITSISAVGESGLTDNGTAVVAGSIYNTGLIEGVTVKNATVNGNRYVGGIAGYVYGSIKNCRVESSAITAACDDLTGEWDNGDKVGGIAGFFPQDAQNVIDGCSVANVKVNGYRDLAGIVGWATGTVTNNTVEEGVVVTVDANHNYKDYKQPAEYDANSIVGDGVAGEGNSGEAKIIAPEAVAVVATAAELKAMLNAFGAAGAGDNVVNITSDIVLADAWTPVVIDGYNGADVIIVNGNGYTISGLTAPLFAGGFAGGSGIVINDLTIDDSQIVSTNTLGSGAFIETVDSMDEITLTNCHVTNSSIEGSRTGGLIGWNSGYNNTNDGAVKTIVTITGCTVENCTITGAGTVGGIVGHAGANAWTWNTIENCKVINCQLISNDDSYRVGGIVGTANVGEVVINNCSVDAATTMVQNNNGTEIARPEGQSNLYGRAVLGDTGSLTIDGVAIQ